jgi:tRNA nucleotidyltransferase/poly(A) polymerase
MRKAAIVVALEVIKRISRRGYDAFIVGGAVRDHVLGKDPKDVDIATNMPLQVIGDLWRSYDIGQSKDFGIVVIAEEGHHFEVAQFRTDGDYKDGRRPESIQVASSLKEDVSRRDFTINALGMDAAGEIVDFVGGRADLEDGVIRTVGSPSDRFSEDYLRMLRAVRFAARFGFVLEAETEAAIRQHASRISNLAVERIREELFKAASLPGALFAQYVLLLERTGLLEITLPEVSALKGLHHDLRHHPEAGGNVFGHVIEALKAYYGADPIVNLSILFHDIGKGATVGTSKTGSPTFYDHDTVGVEMFGEVASRLKLSNKEREAISFAIGHHMVFHKIMEMKASKVAKLVLSPHWGLFVDVAKADEEARGCSPQATEMFNARISRAEDIRNTWGLAVAGGNVSVIDGNKVMEVTGLKPGPEVGRVIRLATTWAVDNAVTDRTAVEDFVRQQVSAG